MRYADPHLCPDCRSPLAEQPATCPSCSFPLRHPVAVELFSTLQLADSLVARLRATVTEAVPLAVAPGTSGLPSFPRSDRLLSDQAAAPRRTGLRAASVPKVLLGLGALCLLVAAVTFLALAWSSLGVGGRTAILVALTATTAGLSFRFAGRGLRVAAESLACVALGLTALDVAGAITAGWLGEPGVTGSVAYVGGGVALLAALLLPTTPRLVTAQLGVASGSTFVLVGLAPTTSHDQLFAFGAILVLMMLARAALAASAPVLTAGAAAYAALWTVWLTMLATGSAATHPSLAGLWVHGHGYGALGLATLLLAPGALTRRTDLLRLGAVPAATATTLLLGWPVVDEGTPALGIAALVGLAAWTATALALPRTWRAVAAGPTLLAAAVAVGVVVDILAVVTGRLTLAPWSLRADTVLTVPDPITSPLLLLPLVAVLLGAAAVWSPVPVPSSVPVTVLALAAAATLASYDVPLAAVVVLLAVAALATRSPVLAVAAVAAAMPSAALAAVAAGSAAGVAALLRRTVVADLLLPGSVGLGVAAAAQVAGLATDQRAYPVLAALGLLLLLVPRPLLEVTAVGAGAVAALAAVGSADDVVTSLAVHLTVAGALVTLPAIVHPHRRVLAVPGGLLLAVATWVRLADLGVTAPEPYTLPTAAALVLVALHRIRRDAEAPTAVLVPGLVLATVPSLLWVVVEPVSLRAVVLGGACLLLVLVGAGIRWSAPVVVGGAVGALLVLRELAPYAQETPQWLLIGFAGTMLTAVGITWEQRLLELRRAATYVGRLR